MRLGLFENSVFLGIENWKATKPVFIGDTTRLKLTVVDKRVKKMVKKL
jgi:3-hydroxybutyryl-CoA dehydratase